MGIPVEFSADTILTLLDEDADAVLFRIVGPISLQQVIDCATAHFDRHPTGAAIWDLRDIDVSNIGLRELKQISACFARYDHLRRNPRTAAIIKSLPIRMLARLYRAVNVGRKRPVQIKAFGDVASAVTWLDISVDTAIWR